MTHDYPALQLVPTLEERVVQMRNCISRCPVIASLDDRIKRQRELVTQLLEKYNLTPEQLIHISIKEITEKDAELQLWYHILRDCDYIDSLR